MTEDRDKLGRLLAQKMQSPDRDICPSTEEIAALADGSLQGAERDKLLRHISSCPDCYEVFSLTTELASSPSKKRSPIFRPMAMAASILIIAASVFIIFKSGVSLKQEEIPEPMMDAVTQSVEEKAPAPLIIEKSDKELMETAPHKKAEKDMVSRQKQATPKLKERREESVQEKALPNLGYGQEKKSRRMKARDEVKMETAGKIQPATPTTPSTLAEGIGAPDLKTRFKKSLEQREPGRAAKGGAATDIDKLMDQSVPGTPDHAFFQLARQGFFHNNKWHGGPASKSSLPQWKALLPRLQGLFHEIALQTIRQLETLPETAGQQIKE